jgi:ribosome modulation factor
MLQSSERAVMTPFEAGYAAFLKGIGADDNPFDAETCPHSRKRWAQGWDKARARRMEKVW